MTWLRDIDWQIVASLAVAAAMYIVLIVLSLRRPAKRTVKAKSEYWKP